MFFQFQKMWEKDSQGADPSRRMTPLLGGEASTTPVLVVPGGQTLQDGNFRETSFSMAPEPTDTAPGWDTQRVTGL